MRKLEKFQSSIADSNLLKNSDLKTIKGGKAAKRLMSKYFCSEASGGNGSPCDTSVTTDCDYDDGTSTSETTTLDCI